MIQSFLQRFSSDRAVIIIFLYERRPFSNIRKKKRNHSRDSSIIFEIIKITLFTRQWLSYYYHHSFLKLQTLQTQAFRLSFYEELYIGKMYIYIYITQRQNHVIAGAEIQEWRGTSGVSIFAIETLCIISDYVLALTSHVGSSREEPTHGWFIRLHRASPGSGRVPTTKGRRKIVAYFVSVFGVAHGAECATRIDHPINFVSLLW